MNDMKDSSMNVHNELSLEYALASGPVNKQGLPIRVIPKSSSKGESNNVSDN